MNTTTYVMRDQVKNVVPLMMTLDPKGKNKPNRMTELATVACLAIGYLTIMTLVATNPANRPLESGLGRNPTTLTVALLDLSFSLYSSK